MEFKMMRAGLLDDKILKESSKSKGRGCIETIISKTISFILCITLFGGFCFSLYINNNEEKMPNGIPVFKVVKSDSMAKKNEKNGYLWGFELNDQIQMFDVILTQHLPAEEELELYDIVVYKRDDISIIHRIVEIEEPNEEHPDHRLFIFQGDAIENPDRFPVLYSQMQGIYNGERIPFVGSLVIFLQSPAGWLCLLLVLFAAISTPVIESRYKKEMKKRLAVISPKSSLEKI